MWFAFFGSIAMSLTMFLYGPFVRLEMSSTPLVGPSSAGVCRYDSSESGSHVGFGTSESFHAPVVVVRE